MAEEKKNDKFKVGEIATQVEPAVVKGDKAYTIHEAIALILNKVENIENYIKKTL